MGIPFGMAAFSYGATWAAVWGFAGMKTAKIDGRNLSGGCS